MPTPTPKHRSNRGFTDAEILDPTFPDPRLHEQEHRALRHQYYREQVRRRAIMPWHVLPNLLLKLFQRDSVEEDTE